MVAALEDEETSADAPAPQDGEITLGVAAGLAAVTLVCFTTLTSWTMALFDAHDGFVAVALAVAAATVLAVAVFRRGAPRVRFDRRELVGAVVIAAVTAFFVLPAFPYAYVDKDPGVYAAHGFAIARDGGFEIEDPALEAGIVPELRPGLWVESATNDVVTPQFYHSFPALIATAHDIGGRTALFSATPLLAIVAVLAFFVAVRETFDGVAGVLAGLLIGTSMIEVWQARTPGSEILVQVLLAGALLGLVCTLRTRWAPPAGIAGVLVTTTFLVRPDGFVYLALAGAGLGIAVALDGWQPRWRWLALGLLLPAPLAWWNAYDLREVYTRSNAVPAAVLVGAALVLPAVVATVIGPSIRRARLQDRIGDRQALVLGGLVAALTAVVLVLFWYRPQILGEDMPIHPVTGEVFRSYDEQALRWLSFFIPVIGLAVMCLGWAVVVMRRPLRPAQLALVCPGLLLLPLYLWDARIASRMMWWTRRFVPIVLPTMLILVAIGLAWLLARHQKPVRVVAAGVALYLLWFGAAQSNDLRDHREVEGSWEMGIDVVETAESPDTAFLFDGDRADVVAPNRNLPGAVWLIHDHPAYRMPPDGGYDYVVDLASALDRPLNVVLESDELPPDFPDDEFVKVADLTGRISLFEETPAHRPAKTNGFNYELGVWRFVG